MDKNQEIIDECKSNSWLWRNVEGIEEEDVVMEPVVKELTQEELKE